MRLADANILTTGSQALRATVGAVAGQLEAIPAGDSATFDATLTIDTDASVPGGVPLLTRGSTRQAVVSAGPDRPGSEPRRLFVKIPDIYAPGEDQDFLLASSGDGAPLHHAVLPSDPVAPLYSSLWLYLAGIQPILFGVRPPTTGPDVRYETGDVLEFLVSPPVGKFRRIGTLTLTGRHDHAVNFSGGSSGGNIRPLPPVNFY